MPAATAPRHDHFSRASMSLCYRFSSSLSLHRACGVRLLLLALLFALPTPARAWNGTVDKTMEVLGAVPAITREELEQGRPLVEKMDYTSMRVFRALCTLRGVTPNEALRLLPLIKEDDLGYDHLLLFEQFCTIERVGVDLALGVLADIKALPYTTVWSATSLFLVPGLNREQALAGLNTLRSLRDAGRWAAKAFFETSGQTDASIADGLRRLQLLSDAQCRAVDAACKIAAISAQQALLLMDDLQQINPDELANVQALLALPEMTPRRAHSWLTGYFRLAGEQRDTAFEQMTPDDKNVLLNAFLNGSDHFVRMINDFHSICNERGDEISEGSLRASSYERLSSLFMRLPGGAREKFFNAFRSASARNDKGSIIYVLRDATAFSRKYSATQLSTANIYALMTRVSVLYDSSFRLILIPELQKRMVARYDGRLLPMLRRLDPDNLSVANFVSSLSLKGRLALFFPANAAGQKEILDLVAASAFQDENSLVLFAATFGKLLVALLPESRDYIIDAMLSEARDDSIFGRLVRTVLRFYLEEQPRLLGERNSFAISAMLLRENDTGGLARYRETPFMQWRRDGVLSSLSIFHDDDDGRTSFLANCDLLLDKGYTFRISRRFRLDDLVLPSDEERLRALIAPLNRRQAGSMQSLFSLLRSSPLAVDCSKQVGPIEISHSIAIYQKPELQQLLIEKFLRDGHEMLAHRGHSYWLNEHILDPLRQTRETARVGKEHLSPMNRFVSIGACGGVNIYAELTRTFCGTIDVLGSLGAGKTRINNLYNWFLFETVAREKEKVDWREMDRRAKPLFAEDPEEDYQLPGELPSLLYKIIGEERCWF